MDSVGIELDTKDFKVESRKQILFTSINKENVMNNKTVLHKDEDKIQKEFNCEQDIICNKCGLEFKNQKNKLFRIQLQHL